MGIQLVNGGRINNGVFESYNKDTKTYDSLGTDANGNSVGKVKSSDFGPTVTGGGVDYSGNNAAVQGITTSYNATNKAKTANDTLDSLTPTNQSTGEDPLAALYTRLSTLQSDLKTAQDKEKASKDALANNDTSAKLNALPTAEEVANGAKTDLSAGVNAVGNAEKGVPTDTTGINDPIIKALTDKTIANVGILNQQMQALGQYRAQFNQSTQEDIDSIARTAERSVQTQLTENDRVKRAMEFAGVVAGRAQFAPVVEQTTIHDVIQEGLDKIEVINEKKNTAIREARKAEADFNIDAFEKQANLAKDYNNEVESTISAMNTQVRQAEQDQRDKIDFRQQQEERSSTILAGELVNATPDEIAKAAVANNIDYGLLSKAVSDAKFTATDQSLSLEERRAAINSSNRANQPKAEKPDFTDRETALLSEAGLSDASYNDKVAFLNLTPTAQNDSIKTKKEDQAATDSKSVDEVIKDVVGSNTWFSTGGTDDKIKAAASAFGINPKGWKNQTEARNFLGTIVDNLKTSYPKITDTEIKDYLTQIPQDATAKEITAYLDFARKGIK